MSISDLYSDEFRAALTSIDAATDKAGVQAAVDLLDEQWTESGESQRIMMDEHWPYLIGKIIHKTDKLEGKRI